jgi:hypothetical protein
MHSRNTLALSRRTMLLTLASAVAAAASGCGGGGGNDDPPPPSPPPQPSRLTLSGSAMLAPDGSPLVLRGINEGTWGEMRQADAATIAAQGAQVVRLPIRWWGLYGRRDIESRDDASPGHFKPGHLAQFLQEIQWCLDAGLWVIPTIDSNCGQNGLQDADTVAYCDPAGAYPEGRNFWTDPTQRQLFKQAWVHLAGLLKHLPRVAFYELLPEPLQDRGPAHAAAVSTFYQELMTAIEDEAGDTRTPFLVGARDAYNISVCDEAYIPAARWADRVVYTGNLFIHTGNGPDATLENIERRLGALAAMRSARNVPVFIQQFGVRTGDDPDGFYLEAGLSRMNAAGIGYAGWQWRQNTTNPDEFAIVVEDPDTGADIVKTATLALYSKYWRA